MKYFCVFLNGEFVTAKARPFPPDCGESLMEIIESNIQPGSDDVISVGPYKVKRSDIDPALVIPRQENI